LSWPTLILETTDLSHGVWSSHEPDEYETFLHHVLHEKEVEHPDPKILYPFTAESFRQQQYFRNMVSCYSSQLYQETGISSFLLQVPGLKSMKNDLGASIDYVTDPDLRRQVVLVPRTTPTQEEIVLAKRYYQSRAPPLLGLTHEKEKKETSITNNKKKVPIYLRQVYFPTRKEAWEAVSKNWSNRFREDRDIEYEFIKPCRELDGTHVFFVYIN